MDIFKGLGQTSFESNAYRRIADVYSFVLLHKIFVFPFFGKVILFNIIESVY